MAVRLNHSDDELAENHEINVTPFIDVMLVLLIIFMVAAPLSTVDVPVDLPVSSAQPQPRPQKPVFVSVQEDLALSLGDQRVGREVFGQTLDAETGGNKDARIFLRADEKVDYGEVMLVMSLRRDAGYLKIALVGLEGARAAKEPAGAPATAGAGAS